MKRIAAVLCRTHLCSSVSLVALSTSWRSSSSSSSQTTPPPQPAPHLSSSDPTSSGLVTDDSVVAEVHKLLLYPLPVGQLFKSLPPALKGHLMSQRTTLEQFLLRRSEQFAVFQEPSSRVIMASRSRHVPGHANRGVEASADQLFGGKANSPEMQAIINVLKYIPVDWAPYTELGIPESIRVHLMNRKAKAWFEKYPQYFEVSIQGLADHTFQVRRAPALNSRQESKGQ